MSFREKWTNFSNVTTFLDACALCCYTDYGRPMKPFFHQNPELLGLGRQFRQIIFLAFEVGDHSSITSSCF